MSRNHYLSVSLVIVVLLASWAGRAKAEESSNSEAHPQATKNEQVKSEVFWHRDYAPAVHAAKAAGNMLLIYFRDRDHKQTRQVDDLLLKNADVRPALNGFSCCKIGRDQRVVAAGKEFVLLEHDAFSELLGQGGIAIIDYRDKEEETFGRVVSVFPLARRKLDEKQLLVLLDLPPGTLTQRTLIFAVRIHPEKPASTTGKLASLLAKESADHSQHQANIRVQGHHNWGRRFQRINRRLPGGMLAQEVCAESWPGQGLFDAAIECVHSWRQSPGHWNAVRSRQAMFGYDMKRGSNGVWYATGIFARRG